MNPIELPDPSLEPLMNLSVEVGAALDLGISPLGQRRMVPILGGQVTGATGRGRVLPGGADWQLVIGGTTAQLDARYVLEFEDGALVYVHNTALRVASVETTQALLRGEAVAADAVYFRCQPRFETSAARLNWLMQRQFIGSGQRHRQAVHLSFFTVG